jgi:subtilase family serine protease
MGKNDVSTVDWRYSEERMMLSLQEFVNAALKHRVPHLPYREESSLMHSLLSKCGSTFLKTFMHLSILLLLISLVSCEGASPVTTQPTPTPPVPAIQFTNYDLKLPAKALNAPILGDLPGNTQLHVGITFKVNQSVLDQLKKQEIKLGQKVDAQLIARRVGISDAMYQQIKRFFGLIGLSLNLDQKHLYLTIDGQAQLFAATLQTHFVIHKLGNRTFYAPATLLKIPVAIASSIEAITGLDSYSAPPSFHLPTNMLGFDQKAAFDCSHSRLAHAYSYDSFWNNGWRGEGMTINLVEIDGVYESDLQTYFACLNHPLPNFINVDGSPNSAVGESTMDVELVASLAPGANINVYQTYASNYASVWTRVNDELNQIDQNAHAGDVVSISLGGVESAFSPQDMKAISASIDRLTEIDHMTVFVSSGDCGAYADGVYQSPAGPTVDFPASAQWSVAVGGTLLSTDQKGNRIGETVWSDSSDTSACNNFWGSGGGISSFIPQPQWQTTDGVNTSNGYRQVPDISAIATNVGVLIHGQVVSSGGTSAAAPVWAAGFVLVNQALERTKGVYAFGPDTFYSVATHSNGMAPYFDVTQGDNLYYSASPGWDYATGWGSPNLADVYKVLETL